MTHDKCCPQDQTLKSEWEEDLEKERTVSLETEELERKCKILDTLSHPARLKMAYSLLEKDCCVCELVKVTGLKPNLVSYHLSKMRKLGVVSSFTRSRWKYYSLKDEIKPILIALSQ